jgi:predicted protein tyrosine phosphatase
MSHSADRQARDSRKRLNVLFICSRNQWRSPTAEKVWQDHQTLSVRSAGTSRNARHPVSESDLHWAEVIFVMERKHKTRLIADFRRLIEHKPIHVMDIPDDYQYMDAELIELLRQGVQSVLNIE